MMPKFKYNGRLYDIKPSNRKDKQYMVNVNGRLVHFGDPTMKEYPGTKRGDNYCTRSAGIKDKAGSKTSQDINSPNFWSRKFLWGCKGRKST